MGSRRSKGPDLRSGGCFVGSNPTSCIDWLAAQLVLCLVGISAAVNRQVAGSNPQ